jgi:hypothetical protein
MIPIETSIAGLKPKADRHGHPVNSDNPSAVHNMVHFNCYPKRVARAPLSKA